MTDKVYKRTAAGDMAVDMAVTSTSLGVEIEFEMLKLIPPQDGEPIDFDEAYKRLRQRDGTRQPGALGALCQLVELGLATDSATESVGE